MAGLFVGETSSPEQTASATSVAVTRTMTAGNAALIVVTLGANQSVNNINDGGVGNTINALGTQVFLTGPGQQYAAFLALNCKGGSTTFTANWTSSAPFSAIYVGEISGLNTLLANTNMISVASPGTGTDAISTGNSNATSAPVFVWSFCADGNGNVTPSAGTGESGHAAQGTGAVWLARAQDKRVLVTGNVASTFTAPSNGTDTFATIQAVFTETGGAVSQGRSASVGPGVSPSKRAQFVLAPRGFTPSGAISGTAGVAFDVNATLGALAGQGRGSQAGPGVGPFANLQFVSGPRGFSAPATALNGSSALTFGQTGNLLGAGALAGDSDLAFGQTGALLGTGALAGTTALTFGESGTLTGTGVLSGESDLSFAASATLSGSGVLAGDSDLVFGASGTLLQPGLNGTAALVFSQTGVILGDGEMAASATLTFASNSTLTASGALAGSSAIAFDGSGTLGSGNLFGSASLAFVASLLSPPSASQDAGRKRRRTLYRVVIDGQEFLCRSLAEAIELLNRAKALAQKVAQQAEQAQEPPKLSAPKIEVDAPELQQAAQSVKREIEVVYEQALVTAEIRMLMELSRRNAEDEDTTILFFM